MFEDLYRSLPGRLLARVIASPWISVLAGRLMDSRLSARFVPSFIRHNNIDMSEVAEKNFGSFNAFFTRRLKEGARPLEPGFVSPCDGLLSVYSISGDCSVPIKGCRYTMEELLKDAAPARELQGGLCLVFRLTPSHYHRYIWPCDGTASEPVRIPGIFHTVRPIALQNVPVFKTNTREYCRVTCPAGSFIQMEIGAAMVGRIVNEPGRVCVKGREKGRFEFGGSTITLLLPKGFIRLDPRWSGEGEIPIKLGQRLDID